MPLRYLPTLVRQQPPAPDPIARLAPLTLNGPLPFPLATGQVLPQPLRATQLRNVRRQAAGRRHQRTPAPAATSSPAATPCVPSAPLPAPARAPQTHGSQLLQQRGADVGAQGSSKAAVQLLCRGKGGSRCSAHAQPVHYVRRMVAEDGKATGTVSVSWSAGLDLARRGDLSRCAVGTYKGRRGIT